MKNKSFRMLTLLLACVMLGAFAIGCTKTDDGGRGGHDFGNRKDVEYTTPLVVAYSPFSEKFSAFETESGYDTDVVEMTQLALLTTDRVGDIVYKAINGETRSYNGTDYTYYGIADVSQKYDEKTGTTLYRAEMRNDIKFSDGHIMDADDVIFNYYVYLDTDYVGSTSLASYDIVGLQEYRTQTSSEMYEKYSAMVDALAAAGPAHEWTAADSWTEEQQTWFYDKIEAAWKADVELLIDAIAGAYGGTYSESVVGVSADDMMANVGLKVAFAMTLWGYGDYADGKFTAPSGTVFTMADGDAPTALTFYEELYAEFEGDAAAYYATESNGDAGPDFVADIKGEFINYYGNLEKPIEGGVPNISGIKKIDQFTVEVTLNGFSAPAIYLVFGILISPMHYYGDEAQYDYDNNKFGFPRGDISITREKTTKPMGAGPYKFVQYTDKVVYFEANENYYRGKPYIKNVQFKEVLTSEVASSLKAGTVDMGEMTGNKANFNEVRGYNSNGELTGNIVDTRRVDNLGYGYIGLNADTINVNNDPSSDASKNLRRAFATLMSAYRDTAVNSYYGDAAVVINYPISNTSWAAPQATDEGYEIAFSTDINGDPIYTSDMTPDERYDAALKAAIGFLEAAGYTFANGKITATPEGTRGKDRSYTEFEVIIPADGLGDHPSFSVLTNVEAALKSIGITLTINDPTDSNVLWNSLNAGTQDMWCAAWQATIDPDMYQVYHSDNIVGKKGTDSNHYHIASPELDQLILDARTSDDQNYRKNVYKDALDELIDWAVEVPVYQRQNCTIFSVERINTETITPDITTFYEWAAEIENMELTGQ